MKLGNAPFDTTWEAHGLVVRATEETAKHYVGGVVAHFDDLAEARLAACAPELLRALVDYWCEYRAGVAPKELTDLLLKAGLKMPELLECWANSLS